jgi:hypothetical protein
MAGRVSNIERRIDMILKTSTKSVGRPVWRVAALAFILAWSCFVLTGASCPEKELPADLKVAEQEIKLQVKQILDTISGFPGSDVDKDGKISFSERNAFLVAAFKEDPEGAIACFPYAAHLSVEQLDLMEIYDTVRGLSYREEMGAKHKELLERAKAKAKADPSFESEGEFKELKADAYISELETVRVVLESQQVLLETVKEGPDPVLISLVHSKVEPVLIDEEAAKLAEYVEELEMKIAQLKADGNKEKAAQLYKEMQGLQEKLNELTKKARQ